MKRFTPVWASALVAIMVFSGMLPLTMNVVAAIPIPHNMWGIPYDETGVRMDVGELITSWIDGVQYGDNDTFVFGPDIRYDIDTDGNWVTAPGDPNSPWEKEGGDLTEPIMYVWGDMTMIDLDPEDDGILNHGVFEETEPWDTTVSTPSDLNLAVGQPPIFPKISMIIPEPTDTYPDYVLIYTEEPFFDMSGFYLEKNDGVLSGPSFALSGLSNATAYFYANLTTMDLDACGDELKLVWSNAGLAFGGNDIVVDRVEWNATTGGTHNVGLDHEPDNTIMTDAAAPACAVTDFAMRRGGVFPVFDTDTNDNLLDFVVDTPWPRPIIGAPVVNVIIPNGGEDWTGGSTHPISWFMYDNNFINTLLTATVNYTIDSGTTWPAAVLDELNPIIPGRGDAFTPVVTNWTLPFADVTDAQIRVCVENPALLSSCDLSLPFEIDSTPPTVTNTDPLDTAIEIPVNKVIEIYFDELMDIDATNASFQITPDPGGVIALWGPNDHASLSHNNFLQNTTYCVDVLTPLAEDDSDPGNAIAATYTFCFTTYEPKAPTITLTYPDGGQIWSGGSAHNIWFNYSHADGLDLTRIWLNYSCAGNEYHIVTASGDPVWGNPYSWNPLPLEDANDCFIHVKIADTDGDKLDDEKFSPDFTIDSTAPTVLTTDPLDDMGGIAITTNVVVTFSEPMATVLSEAAWWMRTGITTVTGQFSWDLTNEVLTFDPDSDLAYFTDYTITIDTGACDISDPGNCMDEDYTFNFTTENTPPPVVQVLYPVAGTTWIDDDVLNITWNMTDEFTPTSQLDVEL
ncbi:MAG: Ig-like domain-containing protein, partial [Methanobacteriota archaeon]